MYAYATMNSTTSTDATAATRGRCMDATRSSNVDDTDEEPLAPKMTHTTAPKMMKMVQRAST